MLRNATENWLDISSVLFITDLSKAVVLLWFSVARFGVRVSVTFHLTCVHIISSPEPKAHRLAYRILVVRRPSVHSAQGYSSPKPLGQSKPNFMWSLLG